MSLCMGKFCVRKTNLQPETIVDKEGTPAHAFLRMRATPNDVCLVTIEEISTTRACGKLGRDAQRSIVRKACIHYWCIPNQPIAMTAFPD